LFERETLMKNNTDGHTWDLGAELVKSAIVQLFIIVAFPHCFLFVVYCFRPKN
jgi:hypothetical protein